MCTEVTAVSTMLLRLLLSILCCMTVSLAAAQDLPFQNLPGGTDNNRQKSADNPFRTRKPPFQRSQQAAQATPSQAMPTTSATTPADDVRARALDVVLRQLPDVRTESPFLIDQRDLLQFGAFLPQGMQELIKRGLLSIAVGRSIPAATLTYAQDASWRPYSAGEGVRLTDVHGLGAGTYADKGFLFGTPDQLESQADHPDLAYKLLWNGQASWWYMGAFQSLMTYRFYEGSSEFRSLSGGMLRVYPRRLDRSHRSEQLFRELLYFQSPTQVQGYSWLTMRFLGADRDRVSVYSNIVDAERQLTASNRSDTLPGAVLAPDDLLGYSGAIQTASATFSALETVFVPVPLFQPIHEATRGGCHITHTKPSTVHVPFRSAGAGEAATPASERFVFSHNVVFTPKKVWRLQLGWGDPYSQYPRQILYLDYDTMLPVIKEVYNQDNGLMKIVLATYGQYESSDGTYPIPMVNMVFDVEKKRVAVVEFKTFSWCPKGLTTPDEMLLFPGRFQEAVKTLVNPPTKAVEQSSAQNSERTAGSEEPPAEPQEDLAEDEDYLSYEYDAPQG